jgi:hypothetical protein
MKPLLDLGLSLETSGLAGSLGRVVISVRFSSWTTGYPSVLHCFELGNCFEKAPASVP